MGTHLLSQLEQLLILLKGNGQLLKIEFGERFPVLKNDENFCPGWCGSVDWVQACEPKGRWFDSQ